MPQERRDGLVVASRYHLDRRLGEGGFAEVWAATHLVTRRRVALKFLKEKHASDDRARHRFVREARAASAVLHPNVVAIHDVFEDDGVPIMVMDLLEGESLGERLKREQTLPLADVATILLPVVSAVHTAHRLGILHRDLKPDNIFLVKPSGAPDGTIDVRVLDFGIAKLLTPEDHGVRSGGLTNSGALLGTPCYMSPEQFFGDGEIDHRSDVWAIGVILYECLAGVRPTDAKNVGLIVKVIVSESITPLAQHRPDLPAQVTTVVMRALSFDCASRPTMHEIGQVLGPYTNVRVPSIPAEGSLPYALPEESFQRSVDAGPPLDGRLGSEAPMALPESGHRKAPRARLMAALVTAIASSSGVGLLAWGAATIALPSVAPSPRASTGLAASAVDRSSPSKDIRAEPPPTASIRARSVEPWAPDASAMVPSPDVASGRAVSRARPLTTRPAPSGGADSRPFDPGSVR